MNITQEGEEQIRQLKSKECVATKWGDSYLINFKANNFPELHDNQLEGKNLKKYLKSGDIVLLDDELVKVKMVESFMSCWITDCAVVVEKIISDEMQENLNKVVAQSMRNELVYGVSMVHVDAKGARNIEPYSEEYWSIKEMNEREKMLPIYEFAIHPEDAAEPWAQEKLKSKKNGK